MRGGVQRRHAETEEESVFVSMTDMTVSFLFIVIILLAFFASQFRPEELVPRQELEEARAEVRLQEVTINRLEDEIELYRRRLEELERERRNAIELYAQAAERARTRIVAALKERVQEAIPEIEVTISEAGDILRFRGDAFFATGQARIVKPRIRRVVEAVAEGLEQQLPCFTFGELSDWDASCNPDGVLVDAVQIEGHTDQQGGDDRNLRLSLARGAETFLLVRRYRPTLLAFLNREEQPVLSVSGYGENRPIAPDTPIGRGLNRRIDLRLIMASVGDVEEIETIRRRLGALADEAFRDEGGR